MNKVDLLDCANGDHQMADDDGYEVEACRVCGHRAEEEPTPDQRQHAPTPGKWWPHARFTEGGELEAMTWVVIADTEAEAATKMAAHFGTRALEVTIQPAPLYIGAIQANCFRISLTRDHEGMPADDGTCSILIYLNEHRRKGISPGRLAMARKVLAALNTLDGAA